MKNWKHLVNSLCVVAREKVDEWESATLGIKHQIYKANLIIVIVIVRAALALTEWTT